MTYKSDTCTYSTYNEVLVHIETGRHILEAISSPSSSSSQPPSLCKTQAIHDLLCADSHTCLAQFIQNKVSKTDYSEQFNGWIQGRGQVQIQSICTWAKILDRFISSTFKYLSNTKIEHDRGETAHVHKCVYRPLIQRSQHV